MRTWEAPIAEALTISDLERSTGVPRSTIHYYMRKGLLPPSHKSAASRALYSQDHLTLLLRITEMKDAGLSLAQIGDELKEDLLSAQSGTVDLARQEYDRVHAAILREATQRFAADGYERTHVAAIIRELGITPQVFYNHFPSKLQLLVESFHTFVEWNLAYVESEAMETDDLGERLLRRLIGDYLASEFGSEVLTHLRSESADSRETKLRAAARAWEGPVRSIEHDMEEVRPSHMGAPPVPLTLLAHSLIGAHHNAATRASWDGRFSRADVMRTHLWLWLAVVAAMSGEIDVDSRLARYEQLVQEMAHREPELPPAPEE